MKDILEEMIFPVNIQEEVSQSFLDYSLSVITDRALPDVRDGLKPVHRRILYSMFEEGMLSTKAHVKSAKAVGAIMGNYHPHGDSSVYDALVRLTQDFSLNHPLVDGHGSFGDIDGNSAAAMRYTEARLSKISEEMLRDIKKNTVPFKPNFSEDKMEPIVLPSRFPNLLVNGTTGIAVGMACSFVPHSLEGSINAVISYIKNNDITIKELLDIIGGPDFPTGGIVINENELLEGYTKGRGRVRIRAKYHIETRAKKQLLVFTEIPYMTKKVKIIEDIVKLCEDKEIEGISDVRDESDEKIALVVEIAKGFDPDNIANILFSKTQLENTYSINNTCLVDGSPQVLSLKELVSYYSHFQEEVIINRTKFELKKIYDRLEIVEGLIIALAEIENVRKIFKESDSSANAQIKLIEKYKLTEIQAKAILDMKLARLTKLQVDELKEEKIELVNKSKYLESVLEDKEILHNLLITELNAIKTQYKKPRRTEIKQIDVVKTKKSNKPEIIIKPVLVAIDNNYNITFIEESKFKNKKNSKDYIYTIKTTTVDQLTVFTNLGKVYRVNVHEIKNGDNLLRLLDIKNESIVNIITDNNKQFVMFLTKHGMIKKSLLTEYQNIKRNGTIGITLKDDDEVVDICYLGNESIILGTKNGLTIHFVTTDITAVGRTAMGVLGIKLKDGDAAAAITPVSTSAPYILTISKNGFAKKTKKEEYTIQKRNGVGVQGIKIADGDSLFAILSVTDADEILIYSNNILVKTTGKDVPIVGRVSQGNHLAKYGNVNNIHII